jgi:hypothetical protein
VRRVTNAHVGDDFGRTPHLDAQREEVSKQPLVGGSTPIENDHVAWFDGLDGLVGMAREEGARDVSDRF